MVTTPPVTRACVIIPTLNEAKHIGALLKQISGEAGGLVGEIIVVDGGSSDQTRAIVARAAREDARIRLLENTRRIQSAGLNLAVRAAKACEFIVRLDAHSDYPPDIVTRLLKSMQLAGADSVVVPLRTVGTGCTQRAIATASNSRLGTGGSAHRMGGVSGFVDHGHHAAMRRDLFERVGGYDETFVANEDAELDYRIRAAGGRIWLDSTIEVIYYPRTTLKALGRQYWRYGIGRASTFHKHREPLRMRQWIPPAAVLALTLATTLTPFFPAAVLLPITYLSILILAASWFAIKEARLCQLLVAPALAVMHFAWGAGFLAKRIFSAGAR